MTVLVLDNPDLIAKAAMASGFAAAALTTETKRPHRLKFHYGFNKHALDAADEAMLQQHAVYLRQHPTVRIQIHGHSDNFGGEDYNQFLSRLRANAVARLLIQEGVTETQIVLTGWGSSRPLATPEDHAANRRVELEYLTQELAQAMQG
ncbi:OmpA family protein [Marinobacter sp. F4206]|uniref:OmpA family protein n=1 Tax=Marinobacter sp. F4206 TaxID=2861777 RepID=UPI001C5F5C81|nr:OmpA family protein [Marinobacter sp. F4206]MBW4934771.1 OmpA family protein [Marinobacter sp. F4206]